MIDDHALDLLFLQARTFRGSAQAWLDKPVPRELLQRLWQLAALPPTAANCSPARVLFVESREAKERLRSALDEGNIASVMAAPVTAIVAQDLRFYDKLPYLFPHADARRWFAGNDEAIRNTAFRNSSLQGAYFMLAARALGLDCGPMSGFDADKVNAEFFAGTTAKANFICSLGYGDPAGLFPRSPRPAFDEVCTIV